MCVTSSTRYMDCMYSLVEHGAKIRLADCNGIRPTDLYEVIICVVNCVCDININCSIGCNGKCNHFAWMDERKKQEYN